MNPEQTKNRFDAHFLVTKFSKPKLGVIHPILQKLPNDMLARDNLFLQQNFVLKGRRNELYEKHLEKREYPDFLLKPFCYVKTVGTRAGKRRKKMIKQGNWDKSTNFHSKRVTKSTREEILQF